MNAAVEVPRVPCTVPVACKLVEWKARPGDTVTAGQVIAVADDNEGPLELTAPAAGTLGKTLAAGISVPKSGVLAYITPDASQTRQNGHHAAISTRAPVVSAPDRYTSHSAPQSEFKPPAPRRRGTLPAAADLARVEVEELAIVPEVAAIVPAPQKATRRSGKTKHATYHLEESQIAQVKRLALEMKLDDDAIGYSESEIVRAAVAMLLALPRPALSDVLARNREREVEHKYGAAGHPRPGNRRHKR